mmetsp:Transcript_48779/g.110698  ORF Transcript_48779/g.110698 Transcript_48779/m.110698 type:complete len:221 (+) Transcript_48779:195-857(+)
MACRPLRRTRDARAGSADLAFSGEQVQGGRGHGRPRRPPGCGPRFYGARDCSRRHGVVGGCRRRSGRCRRSAPQTLRRREVVGSGFGGRVGGVGHSRRSRHPPTSKAGLASAPRGDGGRCLLHCALPHLLRGLLPRRHRALVHSPAAERLLPAPPRGGRGPNPNPRAGSPQRPKPACHGVGFPLGAPRFLQLRDDFSVHAGHCGSAAERPGPASGRGVAA